MKSGALLNGNGPFVRWRLFLDHRRKFSGAGLSPTASPTSFKVKGIFRWTE